MQTISLWLMTCVLAVSLSANCAGGEQRLTSDGRLKSSPCFLDREGTELIYVVEERPTQMRLMRLNLSNMMSTPLDPSQNKSEFDPAVSPDGKYLAFVQSRGNLSLALVIRELVSGRTSEVPPAGGFAGPHSPAFSSEGGRVYYSFPEEGRQRIYSVDRDANDRRVIVDSLGVNIWPDASPDGQRIAWSSTRDNDYEIYSAAPDGSDVRRLTSSPKQDIRPRFSPDGQRIAFMSNRENNYEIYLMQVDGSEVIRLTDNPERDDYPAWHPDGHHLVIVSERDGRHDLFLIPVASKTD